MCLTAILNHIAYVNRTALSAEAATQEDLEKVRKSKVEWVLNVTYITAMWGLMLCLSNMGRIYSPYGKKNITLCFFNFKFGLIIYGNAQASSLGGQK